MTKTESMELNQLKEEVTRLRVAIQDARALCQYLEKHWPEVGLLPSVQSTIAILKGVSK